MRLLFVVLILLVAAAALADAPRTGIVTGVVVDPQGAAMPGATVQLQGERGSMTAVTDAEGGFRFAFILPGAYAVRADLAGFQPVQGEITVSAGGRANVELQLSEAMGAEIMVTGEVPLVNKYDVTAGGTVTTEELEMVPRVDRNFNTTVSFMPGVTNSAFSQQYLEFAPDVEGMRGNRTGYYMDGVDISFASAGGGTRMFVPSFAVSEVKVETSGGDAQYGRFVGGVVSAVVKSGANDFHGEAAWYGQNMDWNENYEVTPVLQPDEIKSSWELSLGGPILKDKLWFFLTYGDRTDVGSALLADGVTTIETGFWFETQSAKLNYQASASHSLTATWIDMMRQNPGYLATSADIYAVALAEQPGDLLSFGWNWAIRDSLFLEAHAAAQESTLGRVPYVDSPTGGDDPWKPSGNANTYQDLLTRLLWNGPPVSAMGENGFPRDQANASLSWFRGVHDVKIGADYQDIPWESDNIATPRVIGRGYNPDAPGGFDGNTSTVSSQWGTFRRYYGVPEGELSTNKIETLALFVRDRISLDRWTFNIGLRMDSQEHSNDSGDVVIDSTDLAPRVTAVYDVSGDSTLLLSATAGRYVVQVPHTWTASFNTTPIGYTYYEQWGWNPATQAYDRPLAGRTPPQPGDAVQVDPYSKDDYTLGADWSLSSNWALKGKVVYWEYDKVFQDYEQIDAAGNPVGVVENNPYADAEHIAFHMVLRRRFNQGWTATASYSYSETKGTCEIKATGFECLDDPGQFIDIVDPATGVPLSLLNADGPLPVDRPHVFKLRGMYLLPLGNGHSLNLAGFFFLQSGQPWARTQRVPILGGARNIAVFTEPRGSHRVPSQKQLNLTLEWQLPIFKQLEAGLRAEIVNVTNEQELNGTYGLSARGVPTKTSLNYQPPRAVRLMARLTF
jgi:hypothetical protein